jgi:hypothetical protein
LVEPPRQLNLTLQQPHRCRDLRQGGITFYAFSSSVADREIFGLGLEESQQESRQAETAANSSAAAATSALAQQTQLTSIGQTG